MASSHFSFSSKDSASKEQKEKGEGGAGNSSMGRRKSSIAYEPGGGQGSVGRRKSSLYSKKRAPAPTANLAAQYRALKKMDERKVAFKKKKAKFKVSLLCVFLSTSLSFRNIVHAIHMVGFGSLTHRQWSRAKVRFPSDKRSVETSTKTSTGFWPKVRTKLLSNLPLRIIC